MLETGDSKSPLGFKRRHRTFSARATRAGRMRLKKDWKQILMSTELRDTDLGKFPFQQGWSFDGRRSKERKK